MRKRHQLPVNALHVIPKFKRLIWQVATCKVDQTASTENEYASGQKASTENQSNQNACRLWVRVPLSPLIDSYCLKQRGCVSTLTALFKNRKLTK